MTATITPISARVRPEMTADEVLDRFAEAYPGRLGPQTRRRILAVVASIPRPPHRLGTRRPRPDLAALAFYLATFGDASVDDLGPIFDRHPSTLYAMVRDGRALAERLERGPSNPESREEG